jgi:hypothetical protein
MKEGRDLSLDKGRLHRSDAIDTYIDRDDASDDLIKEKMHSTSVHQVLIGRPGRIARRFGRVEGRTQACMSATWFVVWPDLVLVQNAGMTWVPVTMPAPGHFRRIQRGLSAG